MNKDALKQHIGTFTDLAEKKKFLAAELKKVNAEIKKAEKPLVDFLLAEDKNGFVVPAPPPSEGEEPIVDEDGNALKSHVNLKKGPTPKVTVNKKHVEARLLTYLSNLIREKTIEVTDDPAILAQNAAEFVYSNLEKPDAEVSYSLVKVDPKPKKQKRKADVLLDDEKDES
jgi:hypothetical protein